MNKEDKTPEEEEACHNYLNGKPLETHHSCADVLVRDKDEKEVLPLGADIYSYTFFKFVKADNPNHLGGLMMKCYFTVMIQLFLTYLKWFQMYNSTAIYLGTNKLNLARVICAYIMHMQMYPELRSSM